MVRFHRYYRLHAILNGLRVPVSRSTLERKLECGRATVMRIIEELRGYGAPIEYVREQNGYRYTPGVAFELPGIWFNASELHALLAAQKLLAERQAKLSMRSALNVSESKLNEHFATAYGIFAGMPKQVAVLRFTAERARWVADEQWHPRQAGRFLEDGRYEQDLSEQFRQMQ